MAGDARSAEERVVLEPYSYVPPIGYANLTSYAYRGEWEAPRLKVDQVASIEESGGMDEALTAYRRQVELFLNAQVEFASVAPETKGELVLRTLVFTFPGIGPKDPSPRYRGWCGFGQLRSGPGVQVEYTAFADDEQASHIYDTVICGIRLAGSVAPGTRFAPGFVYRSTGAVRLPVPESLKPPDCLLYVYETVAGKLRLTLRLAQDSVRARSMVEQYLGALGADKQLAANLGPSQNRVAIETTRSGSNGLVTESVCYSTKPVPMDW